MCIRDSYSTGAWYKNAFDLCKSRTNDITEAEFNARHWWLGENYYHGQIKGVVGNELTYPSAVVAWTTFRKAGHNLGSDGLPCSEQEMYMANWVGDASYARCVGPMQYDHYRQVVDSQTRRVGCAHDTHVGTLCMYF